MLPYLLHTSILFAFFFLLYWILLRKETFFSLNRWILAGSVLLAIALPFLKIPASWSLYPIAQQLTQEQLITATTTEVPQKEIILETTPDIFSASSDIKAEETSKIFPPKPVEKSFFQQWSVWDVLMLLYWIGVAIFVVTFFVQLFLIMAKKNMYNSYKDGRFTIVELIKNEAPYSFWNTIFINPSKYDLDTYEQIIAHEKIHIEQAHFVDKILMESALIFFWFNPFVWFFRRAMTNNLEYLTDQQMLQNGTEPQSYQLSLLKVAVPHYPLSLTTNYNQSFLKKRITMMNNKKSSAQSIWKYLFILPLLGLSILFLNGTYAETNPPLSETNTTLDTSVTEQELSAEPTTIEDQIIDKKERTTTESINITEKKDKDTEKLRKVLVNKLLKDDFIAFEEEIVILQMGTDVLRINGNYVEASLDQEYRALLKEYGITAEKIHVIAIQQVVIMTRPEQLDERTNSSATAISNTSNYTEELSNRFIQIIDKMNAMLDTLPVDMDVPEMPEFPYSDNEIRERINENPDFAEELMEEIDQFSDEVDDWLDAVADLKDTLRDFEDEYGDHEDHLAHADAHHDEYVPDPDDYSVLMDDSEHNDHLYRSKDFHDKHLARSATRLKASATDSWKWPLVQKELVPILQKAGNLSFSEPINMVVGEETIYMNGENLGNSVYRKVDRIFDQYSYNLVSGWQFNKKGDHIIILDNSVDLEYLKEVLLDNFKKDGFIKKKEGKEYTISIDGHQMKINGQAIPSELCDHYNAILGYHQIIPAPGKAIFVNTKDIHVGLGYHADGNFTGTWYLK